MKQRTFWLNTLTVSILISIVAVWLGCLAGPFLLWHFTGGWGWFLLYLVTVPLFLLVPAVIELRMNRERAGKNDKTA